MGSLAVAAAAAAARGARGYGAFCKHFGYERCHFSLTSYHDAATSVLQRQRRRFFAPLPCLSSASSSSSLIPHKYRDRLVSTSSYLYHTTTATKFSTDDDSINKSFQSKDSPTSGPEAFRRYTDLCESLEELRREKERIKSEQMYQAWQKASSKDTGGSSPEQQQQPPADNEKTKQTKKKKKQKNVAAGVAVVQTLAKQTRQEMQQQQRQGQEEAELQAQATKMLQIAALDFDHPEALVTMGNDLVLRVQEQQQHQEENYQQSPSLLLKQALELYQRAGELGSEEGWYNHGTLLWGGYPTQTSTVNHHELLDDENSLPIFLRADQDAAMTCFWKAIDLGDAHAMYFVGAQLLSSDNDDDDVHDASVLDEQLVADLKKGLELMERAGTMGHSGALYYLALLHLNGHQALSVPACPPEQFVARLDAAVVAGNADALFLRGHGHYHGENGYTQDYRKAVEDFLKAADTENADAAVSAAAMLHSGSFTGVPQDQQKAFELYQHAGELGSMEGWRNVVACYARGEGVPKSLEMADYIAKTMLVDEAKKQ